MKSILLSVIFINFLHGQTESKITYGVKEPITHNQIFSRVQNKISGFDYRGSLFSNLKFNDKLSLQTEIFFSYSNFYNYIESPLLLKYQVNKKLSLFAGSKIAFFKGKMIGFSTETGIQYEFNNQLTGSLFLDFRVKKSVNNIDFKASNFDFNPIKFNFKYKF